MRTHTPIKACRSVLSSARVDSVPRDSHHRPKNTGRETDYHLTRAEALLIAEFNQAWEHYRQNETIRTQHFALFSAVTIAAVGVGSQAAARSNFDDAATVLAFSGSLFVFATFTGFIYITLRKVDVALQHYELVWNQVRNYFYRGVDRRIEPYKSLSIRDRDHPMLYTAGLWRFTKIQASIENLVLGAAVLVSCGQTSLTIDVLLTQRSDWPVVATVAALTGASWIVVAGLVALRRAAGRWRPTVGAGRQGGLLPMGTGEDRPDPAEAQSS
jgi:hypothetical protein